MSHILSCNDVSGLWNLTC